MKALISPIEPVANGFRVCELAEVEFPVAAPLFWVDAPEGVSASTHYYADGFVEIPPPEPPAPVIPQQVTRAQGKVVLIQMGLWPQVLAFVDAIEDPMQKAIAEVAVYETLHWQRNSPFLNQAATALEITQEQMDQLFIQASQVML
jgi:hypothetical protein